MTSITKIGGVVVVTQVIPQNETSIPLQSATAQAPPLVPPVAKQPPSATKMDDMTATYLQGELQGLGVVQIFIGVLCVLFSLTAAYSHFLIGHAPFCLAVAFVVSGSLAVARRASVRLVWASLLLNLISFVLGLMGVAYISWLLADRRPSERFCDKESFGGVVPTDADRSWCVSRMWLMDVSLYGSLGLLLVLLVLQVCVALTVCVFLGKAIRCRDRYALITVEVDDDGSALLRAAPSTRDSHVTLLDSDGEDASMPPANSA